MRRPAIRSTAYKLLTGWWSYLYLYLWSEGCARLWLGESSLKGVDWWTVHNVWIKVVPLWASPRKVRILDGSQLVLIVWYLNWWFTRVRAEAGLSGVIGTSTRPFTTLYMRMRLWCWPLCPWGYDPSRYGLLVGLPFPGGPYPFHSVGPRLCSCIPG